MKKRLLTSLVFLTANLFMGQPNVSAAGGVDPTAAAAALRKADADWAASAKAASIGAWMLFYAADALVLLPDEQLASGQEAVRLAVGRVLALPNLSVSWRLIEATVARSGDLAYVVDAYELHFDDSHGVAVSDRGRRLEVWRQQAGRWQCIVDTWKLDASIAAPALPAAEVSSPATSPSAVPEVGPPAPARGAATKYGELPSDYERAIRQFFVAHLKHPESVQYREITPPQQGYTTEVTGGLLMRETREYGWTVKTTINAQDSRGNYVGFKTYTFLFRGEKIVDARMPLPGDEMK